MKFLEKIKNKKWLLIQTQTCQEYDARADKDFQKRVLVFLES